MDSVKFSYVGKPIKKIDAVSLVSARENFTDDFELKDPLYGVFLYSNIAHGEIEEIDTSEAESISGVRLILDYRNTPSTLFTTAGQGFPEPSPYDNRLFDKRVRYVGDKVALVVAETEDAARLAVKKIRVKYRELPYTFDSEAATDPDAPTIHVDDEHPAIPVAYIPEKNIAAQLDIGFGDVEKGFKEADFIVDNTYRVHYASHCAMEPHSALSYMDSRGRLVIVSTTQVPFHVRRIVSMILGIPLGRIRVIKPRIGGGFGGKQEILLEPYVALVTLRTKRSARITLSRREVFISARTRHPMRVRMKMGVKNNGSITALFMDALMNNGAYGSHGLTVLSNTGSKVLPLFNKIENVRFSGKTVYTNLPVGGAYRGYGATQGYFAFNQQIDIITRKLGLDMPEYCKKWHIRAGETSKIFEALGEGKEGVSQVIKSCKLDECIDIGVDRIEWNKKRNKHLKTKEGWVIGVGMAISMQGSGIPLIDMASAYIKMNEDGSFNLFVGATEIGQGSDTVLSQIVAESLKVPVDKIIILSSDTDLTPFDTGAYASSTTYVSGSAVLRCAENVKKQIIEVASLMLDIDRDELFLRDGSVFSKSGKSVTYSDICNYAMYQANQRQIQGYASAVMSESPPPFVAQFAEVAVDPETGGVKPLKFVSAVDCGNVLNPKLAKGQVEGAVVNGISYALTEEYIFDSHGRMINPSFGNYKIFTVPDIPEVETIFVDSYEETGPYGAKSVGEIGINGPAPAIANAIFDAVGVRMYETPFTPERVYRRMMEVKGNE